MQRLLAARNRAQSQIALLSSWIVIFFQFALFLVIGVCLFVQYRDRGMPAPAVSDRLYPLFIWQNLPVGVAGLVMAAILAASMSNLSAALNALASTTVLDLIRPVQERRRPAERPLPTQPGCGSRRFATVVWGAILAGIALLARHWGSVLQAGLSIASIVYGALLGVFLLGLLTKRVRETDAIVGMAAGLAAMLYVRFATSIAFTWYVVIGSAATFIVGLAMSGLHQANNSAPNDASAKDVSAKEASENTAGC